jgi:hypothetical protein
MYNKRPVKPGIGWSDDLLVRFHEGDNGAWYPQVNPGWYYLDGKENYLYAREGWADVVVPSGSTLSLTLPPGGDLSASLVSGPLIIDGAMFRYQRLTSNFSAFNPVVPVIYTPSSGASGFLMSVSVSGELLLATGADGTDMVPVPGISYLQQRNYYYWDFVNRLFWIARDPNDPNRNETLYLSWMKDRPDLNQDEILLVDSDGLIRTMFSNVVSPVLITIPGVGATSGSAAGNVITPGISLSENQRVSVRYLVDGSFCVSDSVANPGTSNLSVYRSVSEPATVRWENAKYGAPLDIQPLQASDGGMYGAALPSVQLNPLITGISDGFVYLSDKRDPTERLASLDISVSSETITAMFGETVNITITALDSNNIPLAGIPITALVTGPSYQSDPISLTSSIQGATDFNGNQFFSWVTNPSIQVGTYAISASAFTSTGIPITQSVSIVVSIPLIMTDALNAVKVTPYLNPNTNPNGLLNLYAYVTTQLGVPVIQPMTITIQCNLGLLYLNSSYGASGAVNGVKYLSMTTNTQSLTAMCQYFPVSGDIITIIPSNINGSGYSFESVPLLIP